jgi:exonuclease SbcD
MRIVHPADWHVGRIWKNVPRLPEMTAVLDHLARFLEAEKIDLVLMAGDVFDSGHPNADAEKLVFQFFRRIGQAGTQAVVIAGNHDSPPRLDAWGLLTELVGVYAVGRPRPANKGGLKRIVSKSGETALVAALPFAPLHTWVSALELTENETQVRSRYAEGIKQAIQHLCSSFAADTINLIVAHTHLEGAVFGESERRVHIGDDWAAAPQAFPPQAHYIALGHIHKPQKVEAAPAPAYYCGSPLQLDFGEAGQEKSFILLEAKPRQPVSIEHIPYKGGMPLAKRVLTLAQIEEKQDELQKAGYLDITVQLLDFDPDLGRKVRRLVPNAISIHPQLPERPAQELAPPPSGSPVELYRAYHQQEHGQAPSAEVEQAFETLHAQAAGDSDASAPA